MFKLVTLSEGVCVPARHFGAKRLEAFEHAVNARYANRVVPGVGLVVGVWTFVSIGEERLLPSCGSSVADCVFRLVVFAPFVGEVVYATIAAAAPAGIAVSVPFFGVMHVAAKALPPGSTWDEKEMVWVWRPPDVEEDGGAHQLFMDVSNESVVRVTEVKYSQPARTPPGKDDKGPSVPPMIIKAALYDPAHEDNQGLGNPLWWYEGDGEEEGAYDGEEDGEADDGEEMANADDAVSGMPMVKAEMRHADDAGEGLAVEEGLEDTMDDDGGGIPMVKAEMVSMDQGCDNIN